MKKILCSFVLIMMLSGCSFLPKLTFNRTTSTLPQQTEKLDRKVRCKGDVVLDSLGRVQSCTNGYWSNEHKLNVSERKFTVFERIGNFVANLKGWFGILIIASVVLTFMGFGGLVVSAWTNLFGTTKRALMALSTGISKGKKYVRQNGTKYTLEQKEIYNQGANDVLAKIAEATDDKKIKLVINKIRAKIQV